MSELPGTAAVGIETVEWFAEGGGNLTVRITGRWRRRRPSSSGQPTLVVEAEGRRHRFPAMPEPPSVGGMGPGMWRLSFSVPGWLAPDLGGRAWLQMGTVVVPLAIGAAAADDPRADGGAARAEPEPDVPPGSREPDLAEPPHEDHLTQRRLRSSELATETARRRAEDAERAAADLAARIDALEHDLDQAHAGRDQLTESLSDRDRLRRIAEQRAHAEQALRRDLVRQLASSARETDRAREAMGELAAAEDRIRTLEVELRDVRRRTDEAEQIAAAAAAARERAERTRTASIRPHRPAAASTETLRLRFEQDLVARRAGDGVRVPSEPELPALRAPPAVATAAASPPTAAIPTADPDLSPPHPAPRDAVAISDGPLMHTLRRELDARASADAALRARLIDAEARLAARVLLQRRTTATLDELRGELEHLRSALERERAGRAAAERRVSELELGLSGQRERSRNAHDAIDELRGALGGLRSPDPAPDAEAGAVVEAGAAPAPAPASPPGADQQPAAGLLEPARLSDALTRLRETIAPQDAAPGAAVAAVAAGAREPSLGETVARPSLAPIFGRLVAGRRPLATGTAAAAADRVPAPGRLRPRARSRPRLRPGDGRRRRAGDRPAGRSRTA
jgi:hypothetical protein